MAKLANRVKSSRFINSTKTKKLALVNSGTSSGVKKAWATRKDGAIGRATSDGEVQSFPTFHPWMDDHSKYSWSFSNPADLAWRYMPEHNQVWWDSNPTDAAKFSVEDHLAKHGINTSSHGNAWNKGSAIFNRASFAKSIFNTASALLKAKASPKMIRAGLLAVLGAGTGAPMYGLDEDDDLGVLLKGTPPARMPQKLANSVLGRWRDSLAKGLSSVVLATKTPRNGLPEAGNGLLANSGTSEGVRKAWLTRKGLAAPPAKTPEQMTLEDHAALYPVVKPDAEIDGRTILNPDHIANYSSIEASITNPDVLPGLREVPMSDFTLTGRHYSVEGQRKIDALAEAIQESKSIAPLIVVRDHEGAYILEGATRADALFKIGAKSFPAKVVLEVDDIEEHRGKITNSGDREGAIKGWETRREAADHIEARAKHYGGKNAYYATEEYKRDRPSILDAWKRNPPTKIVPYQGKFGVAHPKGGLLADDAMLGGPALFDTPDAAKAWAKKKGLDAFLNASVPHKGLGVVPTPKQAKAGNYRQTHTTFCGLGISIENISGSTRSGIGENDMPWTCIVPCDYGSIKGTSDGPKDGDMLDCYLSVNPSESALVYIINQLKLDGSFDELKCFFGFDSEQQVKDTYNRAFADGSGLKRMGSIATATIDQFKRWIKVGELHKPADTQLLNVGTHEGVVKSWEVRKHGGKYATQGSVGEFHGRPILKGTYGMSNRLATEEVKRVAPMMDKIGKAWKKEILKNDPKAKMEIRGTKDYLDRLNYDKHQTPSAFISVDGESRGHRFGIGVTLYPSPDGNSIKMDDSSLPKHLQRKGIFSSGVAVAMHPDFRLSGKMGVHHSSNDKAWQTIADKFGLNWKGWQDGPWVEVKDRDLHLFNAAISNMAGYKPEQHRDWRGRWAEAFGQSLGQTGWDKFFQKDEVKAPEPKWHSAGAVVYNEKGEVAIVAPKNQFGGYEWTFPKGKIEEGESTESAAHREVGEESGISGELGEHLGQHEGTNSFTDFYLMKHTGTDESKMDKETQEVRWVKPEDAIDHLDSPRDLKVLIKAIHAMRRAGIQNSKFDATLKLLNAGDTEGALLGWETRRHGRLFIPKDPEFISSNQANVAANLATVAQIRKMAESNDIAGLKAFPISPSPKINAFRASILHPAFKTAQTAIPAPIQAPVATPAKPVVEQTKTMADLASIKSAVSADGEIATFSEKNLSPSNSDRVTSRNKVIDAILTQNLGIKNAVLNLIPESGVNTKTQEIVGKITKGNVAAAQNEYRFTPTNDIAVLGGINVQNTQIWGQANCQMATRVVTMGTTSAIGDYRHELGHAIRASLSSPVIKQAIIDEYNNAKARQKAYTPMGDIKPTHDWYEKNFGVIGKRGLDNMEEFWAEGYRGYHKAIFQDKFEGGEGKKLDRFRLLHPGLSRIFDCYYTAALLK